MLGDKDVAAMLALIVAGCRALVATRSTHRRAADPACVAAAARRQGAICESVADPHTALARAIELAGPEGGVLVCGSLYLLGDLRPGLVAGRPAA